MPCAWRMNCQPHVLKLWSTDRAEAEEARLPIKRAVAITIKPANGDLHFHWQSRKDGEQNYSAGRTSPVAGSIATNASSWPYSSVAITW